MMLIVMVYDADMAGWGTGLICDAPPWHLLWDGHAACGKTMGRVGEEKESRGTRLSKARQAGVPQSDRAGGRMVRFSLVNQCQVSVRGCRTVYGKLVITAGLACSRSMTCIRTWSSRQGSRRPPQRADGLVENFSESLWSWRRRQGRRFRRRDAGCGRRCFVLWQFPSCLARVSEVHRRAEESRGRGSHVQAIWRDEKGSPSQLKQPVQSLRTGHQAPKRNVLVRERSVTFPKADGWLQQQVGVGVPTQIDRRRHGQHA